MESIEKMKNNDLKNTFFGYLSLLIAQLPYDHIISHIKLHNILYSSPHLQSHKIEWLKKTIITWKYTCERNSCLELRP